MSTPPPLPPPAYSAGSVDLRDGSQDLGRSDWMQTFTGRAFYALDPRIEDICIEDIAHALSMLCRYGGHSRLFYSVAEHSVLMSLEVAPEHALWALLHDSTEAYMGDLIRPLKRQMPTYAAAEDNLMGLICAAFGLPIECPAEVKQADTRILLDERRALLGPSPQKWGASIETAEPLGVQVQAWEPDQAEFYYLARFRELRDAVVTSSRTDRQPDPDVMGPTAQVGES